jgi:hypothetical protein
MFLDDGDDDAYGSCPLMIVLDFKREENKKEGSFYTPSGPFEPSGTKVRG